MSEHITHVDMQLMRVIDEIESNPTIGNIIDLFRNRYLDTSSATPQVLRYRIYRLRSMGYLDSIWSNKGLNNPMWYLLTKAGYDLVRRNPLGLPF